MNRIYSMLTTSLMAFLVSFFALNTNAQDTASIQWELSLSASNNYTTLGALVGEKQQLSDQLKLMDYGGLYLSQRLYAAGGEKGYWPNEVNENTNRYCQFSTYPRKGVSFKLSNIALQVGGGGSNKFMVSIYYSTDNFATQTALTEKLVLPLDELEALSFDLSNENIKVDLQKTVSIRVYPWLFGGESSDKYLNIHDINIKGISEGEVVPDLPVVETLGVDKISTQSLLFSGKATDDGGVAMDSLGVVYSTDSNATVGDFIVLVEPKKGNFTCPMLGLHAGTTYYARSFAVNGAGTTYGHEISFTTLDKLSVPGVSTVNVDHVSPNGAVAYGNVYFDGGLEVSLTGFCYSTQASPTINDFVVNEGNGLGKYNAYVTDVEQGESYYLRAFAENSEGLGYGDPIQFTIPITSPEIHYVVDQNGKGDFTTLQAAFDAVPSNYSGNIIVEVKNGIYKEKVLLESGKNNVHLLGENRDSTLITWDDYSSKVVDGVELGTATSQTIAIDADDFIAQNISFQNTYNGKQAVALRVKGDRIIFNHCNLLGFQDTYYTWGRGRIYHEDCYIEGTVDFIFGSSVAIFKNCTIKSKRNSPVTAANTEEGFTFGYVFMNCKLIADDDINKASLGRPWRPYAQTVYLNTDMGAHIIPEGWIPWNANNNHLTAYYAEYNCSGAGYVPESRVAWSHQLTDVEAQAYTLENIFAKESAEPDYAYDWMPVFEPIATDPVNVLEHRVGIKMSVYPNPISNNALINYVLSANSKVDIAICAINGQIIQQLTNAEQQAGVYQLNWSSANVQSGVYVCRIRVNGESKSQLIMVE